MPFFFSLSKLI